jgi:hypothetical protein
LIDRLADEWILFVGGKERKTHVVFYPVAVVRLAEDASRYVQMVHAGLTDFNGSGTIGDAGVHVRQSL